MNRQQKKCVIVTAGVHALLLLILIVGPAFFAPKPKDDDQQVLDVIPATLVDAAFKSGVANAQPPPPAPVVTPPPPVPDLKPPEPVPPKAEPPKPVVRETEKAPVEKPKEPDKPKVNLKLVTRPTPKATPNANDAARARAIRNAVRSLKKNLTTATTIDMPGDSSVAYADYAAAVRSIYDDAWTLPGHVSGDEEITRVSVTIASDGTVVTARILTPSGDANVDASVQHALERVKFIAPFPEGATEKERTYIINFNTKTKQMLE